MSGYSRRSTSDIIDEEENEVGGGQQGRQINSVSSYLKAIRNNPQGLTFTPAGVKGHYNHHQRKCGYGGKYSLSGVTTGIQKSSGELTVSTSSGGSGGVIGYRGVSSSIKDIQGMLMSNDHSNGTSTASSLSGSTLSINSINPSLPAATMTNYGHLRRNDNSRDLTEKRRGISGNSATRLGLIKHFASPTSVVTCGTAGIKSAEVCENKHDEGGIIPGSGSSCADHVILSSDSLSQTSSENSFETKKENISVVRLMGVSVVTQSTTWCDAAEDNERSTVSVGGAPVATVQAAPRSNGAQHVPNLNPQNSGTVDVNGINSVTGKKHSDVKLSSNAKAPSSTSTETAVKKLKQLEGYVGFANLPNQVYRKAVKRGFEFTLMVVGESGLGKSTLINSMFLTDVYSSEVPGPSLRLKKTVSVETNKVVLKESGVNLTLTVVDTPGFGDAVDNSNCWDPVIAYVESQYEAFLNAETRVNRVVLPDSRVHACLYFIAPSGHGLKPLDVEFMKRLHDKVNIIPVIGKADTQTPEEIAHFKRQIMNQIVQNKIKIYEFPDDTGFCTVGGPAGPAGSSASSPNSEEERERRENKRLKERVPFAVVGSNTLIDNGGDSSKKIRGRKYPWGVVDIEDMDHCDFVPLRNMLIRTHLQDLKEVTNNIHYENFRCRKLAGVAGNTGDKISNKNPLAQIEEERRDHQAKMEKTEREMQEVFERKVREKRQKLLDSEADLEKRHAESLDKLESQKRDLATKMAAFEREKSHWEQVNRITIDELKRLSMESLDGGKKKKAGGALSGVSFRMGR